MNLLVVKAWIALMQYDLTAKARGYQEVQRTARRKRNPSYVKKHRLPWQTVRDAVEIAAVLYFKEVHCLQRSSVTTQLLRGDGWDAHLVVGVQIIPFASHAWVELDGVVVNDKPYMREKYRVLGESGGGTQ
jgi:Transglutaminase-like superfamily